MNPLAYDTVLRLRTAALREMRASAFAKGFGATSRRQMRKILRRDEPMEGVRLTGSEIRARSRQFASIRYW